MPKRSEVRKCQNCLALHLLKIDKLSNDRPLELGVRENLRSMAINPLAAEDRHSHGVRISLVPRLSPLT
jgi:hypothetical protein